MLEVARRTVIVLNENFTRFAVTEAYNPQVNEAMNYFMVSPDKYWFPSASGKYREALADLKRYTADLSRGRSRFYTRVDNLSLYSPLTRTSWEVPSTTSSKKPRPMAGRSPGGIRTIISISPRAWPWG